MLRLCSYNIHGGITRDGRCDLGAFHNFFEDYKVDIAILQEVDTRASRRRHMDDILTLAGATRPYHFFSPTITEREGWYGNAILSKHPIKRENIHNLTTDKRLQPRNAADALIETNEGTIRVIGTHLSLKGGERISEVDNLLALMQEIDKHHNHPLVICGDFNEWLGRIKLLKKMDELFNPIPLGRTFPSSFPVFKLDRVWYEGPGIQAEAKIIKTPSTQRLSDHLPLIIDVTFQD